MICKYERHSKLGGLVGIHGPAGWSSRRQGFKEEAERGSGTWDLGLGSMGKGRCRALLGTSSSCLPEDYVTSPPF